MRVMSLDIAAQYFQLLHKPQMTLVENATYRVKVAGVKCANGIGS